MSETSIKQKIFVVLRDLFQADRFESEISALVSEVLNIILKTEIEDLIGVGDYERSSDRMNCRNGYRQRTLRSQVGPIEVQIPRLRKGSFKTALFTQFKDNEQIVYQIISGMCQNNVKRTQVKKLYTAMTRKDISKNSLMNLMDQFELLSDKMERTKDARERMADRAV